MVGTPRPRRATTILALYQRRNYGPERVAVHILRAVRKNRAVAPVSPEAWAMYFLKRLAPGLTARLNRALAARVERRRRGVRGVTKGRRVAGTLGAPQIIAAIARARVRCS